MSKWGFKLFIIIFFIASIISIPSAFALNTEINDKASVKDAKIVAVNHIVSDIKLDPQSPWNGKKLLY